MSVKLQQITSLINKLAPKHLAADWDNTGLQIGEYNQEIERVMVSLDVNQQVLQEAIDNKVDLIIAHHPVIFNDLSNIRFNTPLGKLIKQAIKSDIAIYVIHTNYDIATGGLNDVLATKLGLTNTDILDITKVEELKKLVVFVPNQAVSKVKQALSEAGAGWIGNYSNCFFQQQGKGSFKPLDGTNPYLGTQGEVNQVDEYRLETIVPHNILSKVVKTMVKVHPYEEVAYDIYPVENKGNTFGLGRIGRLETTTSLAKYSKLVKEKLNLNLVKFVGSAQSKINKVALCSGSGADFIQKAVAKGADVLVTGDIKYHEAELAEKKGLNLIDAGHYGTEKIMKEAISKYLLKQTNNNNLTVEIIKSKVNTNPFKVI